MVSKYEQFKQRGFFIFNSVFADYFNVWLSRLQKM